MTEAQKKQKQLQKVSESLNTFKQVADKLRALTGLYTEWIDEAAKNGDDEYSNQLIEEKVENDEIVADLDSLYRQVLQQATLAAVLGELSTLPAAVKACKGLLSASPNFKKIGKSVKSFRSELDKARLSLHEMRQELRGQVKSNYNPDFFANLTSTNAKEAAADPKHRQRLEAEKAARDARLAAGVVSGMVAAPVNTTPATAEQIAGAGNGATDVDEIIAAMDEEKRKG